MNTWTVSLEASLRGSSKCQEKLCARVQGWTALKIKQPAEKKKNKCAKDKTRQCGMEEEARNEASWSQSRQAEEG